MKLPSLGSRRSVLFSLLATSALLSLSARTVQADDYYYNNANGGDGTWQDGVGPWFDAGGSGPNAVWDNTLQNEAIFQGNAGTVTVVAPVSTNYMLFQGGAYTLQGGDIDKSANNSQGGLVIQDNTGAPIVIDSNLNLDVGGNTDRFNIEDNAVGASITFNGMITYTGTDNAANLSTNRSLILNTGGSNDTFVLHGLSSGTATAGGNPVGTGIRLGEGSTDTDTLYLYGDYTHTGQLVAVEEGTVIIATSQTGPGTIQTYNDQPSPTLTHTVLTAGAQNLSNEVDINNRTGSAYGFVTLGGSTADVSSYNGVVAVDSTDLTLTAATGGRVNFTNTIFGNSPDGIVKTGNGTIVLSGANTFGAFNFVNSTNSALAADLKAGTTLIKNTSGSAFGNNTGVVNVEAGATLGGNGISTQTVIAVGPTSIIAPGDSGSDGGVASTGTLTLAGGLEVDNGATLNFKINGLDNDKLNLASGDFIPTGDLTINLLNMGNQDSILSNHYYTLIDPSAGTLDPSGANVNVIAPYGYAVEDIQFGTFTGLEVELIAAPEPSTYALMLGGLGFLAFCLRRKSRV